MNAVCKAELNEAHLTIATKKNLPRQMFFCYSSNHKLQLHGPQQSTICVYWNVLVLVDTYVAIGLLSEVKNASIELVQPQESLEQLKLEDDAAYEQQWLPEQRLLRQEDEDIFDTSVPASQNSFYFYLRKPSPP